MPVTPLTPPNRNMSAEEFDAASDSFFPGLQVFADEINVVEENLLVTNSTLQTAITAANAAVSAVSAIKWVPGTTYAIGDCRWSHVDYMSYRRKTDGAGTTDPSADATNWAVLTSTIAPEINASQTLINLKTVDGPGSGLDADLLDGLHASSFQATLVSGSNVKTINNSSIVGGGNIEVTGIGGAPIGSIVAWMGGYFNTSANGSFNSLLGNSVSAANSYLNTYGWYVCDGSAPNVAGSPIFNTDSRRLPNLTDSRFIQGESSAGAIGGDNAPVVPFPSHYHSYSCSTTSGQFTLGINEIPSHGHMPVGQLNYIGGNTTSPVTADIAKGGGYYNLTPALVNNGSGGSHAHSVYVSGNTDYGSGSGSTIENRPKFISALMIMRVV